MRSRLVSAAVTAVLLVAATSCSSDADDPAGPSESDAVAPSPSVDVFEGPASRPALWPDGVSATLRAVERVPSQWGVDVAESDAIIRLTLEVSNASETPLPVEPSSKEMTLSYGPSRAEGQAVTSNRYDSPAEQKRKELDRDGGREIAAAGTATFVESQLVPADQLGSLTVRIELPSVDGPREPFTLTEVEKLLTTVR
ncbi:hypothetical protein [Micromonospora sp. NBRC 101691]|uniref:hypothetical protein n=1 Tax=Micromonospora sp. NBRC 101691 TaxID=3032198 RepID=UPI0024A282CD|nr:hypothetical protein [Micromonospora sp. NBRC 101691]GLY20351.1 hypothetical protein Misp04_00830 [Micromonospora sp. NBRC 101691]